MKTETRTVAVDYTMEEVVQGINNVWGNNCPWLEPFISTENFLIAVNKLHQIYFLEEKNFSLERIIEDTVFLVTHKSEYYLILDLVNEKSN